jgi:hypothetical protein
MRMDGGNFPDLEELTGDRPAERREQAPDVMAHNARMWIAVLKTQRG